ncbi:MAG: alpha amylase C-terminal domain-containing protein [Terracidiphilus sp.]|jgi:alpha-amylase
MKLPKRLYKGLAVLAIALANLALPAPTAKAATLNPSYTSVVLFKWRWTDIGQECTNWLGPQGYGAVETSPPNATISDGNWWDMYQPVNFTSLTSTMGNQAQYQAMINACHAAGVRVYADVTVNDMAVGPGAATDGSSYNSSTLSYPYFSAADFHSNTSCTYSSESEVWVCWLSSLPDLKTESSYVQGQIENYMELLISLGVDGFRMDAAKFQPYANLETIFAAVRAKYPKTNEGNALYITQEITPDNTVNYAGYEGVGAIQEFEFTYAMEAAFRNTGGETLSSLPSMIGNSTSGGGSYGLLNDSNDVEIFVDDWDTERNNGGSLTASDLSGNENDAVGNYRFDLANIFMLAQPYAATAQVESGFRFTNGNQDYPSSNAYVNGVAQIPSTRTATCCYDFIHRWTDISNMVKFRTATYGLSEGNWTTGTNNQIAFSRGDVGFVALNNDDATVWNHTFQTGLPAGTYCNVVHGQLSGTTCTSDTVVVNSSGEATLSIPTNSSGTSLVPAVAIYTGQKE